MKSKVCLILSYIIFSAIISPAQVLQPEDPSFLPPATVNIKKTPSYTPRSELINLIEQSGLYPYKGKECNDQSMSVETGENGKAYPSNEFLPIKLNITQYGTQGKMIFTQLKPYDISLKELMDFAASSRTEPDNIGSRRSRNVILKDVAYGKMVLVIDIINCMESHSEQYTVIHFRSVALTGTTIISVMGSYNSSDEMLAQQIQGEIIEKINKGFH